MTAIIVASIVVALPSTNFQVAVIAHVQELLRGHQDPDSRRILVSAAPQAIWLYYTMMDAPDTHSIYISGLYSVIASSDVDRKRFMPLALRHLTHPKAGVRSAAVTFIGSVGTAADSGPLLVLLSDADPDSNDTAYTVARVLGWIGDERTVVALDVWLLRARKPDRDPNHPSSLVRYVAKARDEIKARLAAEKAKAPPAKNAAKP